MDAKMTSYLWAMTFPSYIENLKKEQNEISRNGMQYSSGVYADYEEKIHLVEQLHALDFYYQDPKIVLEFLENKKNDLQQSDYVAPSESFITTTESMLDYLIKIYEVKVAEHVEQDAFSSDIPQINPEAFRESARRGEAPMAEQFDSVPGDEMSMGHNELDHRSDHSSNDEEHTPFLSEEAINTPRSVDALKQGHKDDLNVTSFSDKSDSQWDSSPSSTDAFQVKPQRFETVKNITEAPHSNGELGYGPTNLLGQFISGCCNVLRALFKPKTQVINSDYPGPLTREAFDEKVSGLLKTWNFRRDHFDRHWINMMQDQGTVEDLVERIRLNPLMSRAMNDFNNADTENERLLISKQLVEAMADPHSKHAPELKHDISALNLGLNKLRQSSRSCVEASLKEPLSRFGCDQAVEKNLTDFFETVLDKPELKLLESEKGENLYEKASRLARDTIEFLKHLKEKFAGLVVEPSVRTRNSMSHAG